MALRRYRHRVSRIAWSWFVVWLITAMLAVLSGNVISGWSLVALWFTAALVDLVLRRAYDLAVAAAIGQDLDTVRVLFIGPEEACRSLGAAMIAADPGLSYRAVGRIGGDETGRLSALFQELWPSEVVIADLGDVGDSLMGIIEACRSRHCALKVAADEQLSQALQGLPASGHVGARAPPLLRGRRLRDRRRPRRLRRLLPAGLRTARLPRQGHARAADALPLKRVFDVTVAAVLLVLLSPVFLVVALAIKLTSRGPVHFAAPRVGVGQKVFTLLQVPHHGGRRPGAAG